MLRGKYFRNSLALILVISSIPGLIFGGIIYWIAGGWLENALLQLHFQGRDGIIEEERRHGIYEGNERRVCGEQEEVEY